MLTQLCKLEITLPDCHVAVSRTIVVPIDTPLNALHVIIQKTMGWRNVHTHEFQTRTKRYGQKMYRGDDIENENFCILNHLVNASRKTFNYVYDLGEEWVHKVKAVDLDCKLTKSRRLFSCIAGKGACPPEDVGGPGGYKEFCENINDATSAQYAEMREWAYHECCYPQEQTWPDGFDLESANAAIADYDKWYKKYCR